MDMYPYGLPSLLASSQGGAGVYTTLTSSGAATLDTGGSGSSFGGDLAVGGDLSVTGGARVGAGSLALASDEIRLTPSGRSDGIAMFHRGSGNYGLKLTGTGAAYFLADNAYFKDQADSANLLAITSTTVTAYNNFSVTGTSTLTGNVGIGGAAGANASLWVRSDTGAFSTGVVQNAIYSNSTFNSNATTSGRGLTVGVGTEAAAFTMSGLYNIYVVDASKGAGSTITTQYGLYVEDLTSGGTNYAIYTAGTTASYFGGAVTSAGMLTVQTTGPHAIGGATLGYAQMRIYNSFTSDGSSTVAEGLRVSTALTAATGDTAWHAICTIGGTGLGGSITTQGATETIGVVSSLHLREPAITVGSGDTITTAATLYVASQPTEGSTNAGIITASGVDVIVGGDLTVSGTAAVIGAGGVVRASANDNVLAFSGGSAANQGGNFYAFGGTHATRAGDWVLRSGATEILDWDQSATEMTLQTGSFVASSTGPHAIGGATSNQVQILLTGAYTSGGAATFAAALGLSTDLTAANGDTAWQALAAFGSNLGGSITTQSNSETIGRISTLELSEPNITKGTDTVTVASTLYVASAPTEGASNYALFVDAGASRFDGDVYFESGNIYGGTGGGLQINTDNNAWIDIDAADGGGRYFQVRATSSETVALHVGQAGLVGIYETANANMTIGLTINQGTADDQILALKSSDVATGLTTVTASNVETDDWLTIQKTSGTQGGAKIQVMAEDDTIVNPFQLLVYGGTADTTKTTAADGLMAFYASEHDGANGLANVTADGNVFVIKARVGGGFSSRFLVDEDGDLYSVTAAQTFDEHNDLELLNRYDIVRRDSLRQQYSEFANEFEDELISLGILGGRVADGGMTNVTQLQRLLVGAMRQVSAELADTKARLEAAEAKLLTQGA